jgi:hypothetical protein
MTEAQLHELIDRCEELSTKASEAANTLRKRLTQRIVGADRDVLSKYLDDRFECSPDDKAPSGGLRKVLGR